MLATWVKTLYSYQLYPEDRPIVRIFLRVVKVSHVILTRMKIFWDITQRYRQTEPLCENQASDKETNTLNMGTCDPKAGGGGEGVGAASCPVGSSDNLCRRNRISSGSAGEVAYPEWKTRVSER